jgi:methylglutaconyl-CoA hydratase
MTDSLLISKTDGEGVTTLTVNRPDVHNAFNEELIAVLTEAFHQIAVDASVRVVVLAAVGKSFSAGADLNWMREMAGNNREGNVAGAVRMAEMLRALDCLPQPTVARVHGAAFAGGIGLIGACDIALASESAIFAITEVRLGLIPSVISPYVLRAIGPRAARRYFLTGERFDAEEAFRLGLVHAVAEERAFDELVMEITSTLRMGGPRAIAGSKALVAELVDDVGDARMRHTAARIADIRAGEEAREGMESFLEKRRPSWQQA